MRAYVLRTEAMVDRLVTLLRSTWKAQLHAGEPLEVVVSAHKKRRSHAQNRLYWVVLDQVSQQAYIGTPPRRYQKEHWHEFFARTFIGYEELPDDGGKVALSTTNLDAHQFSDYITKIQAWAAEHYHVVFEEEHG